MQHETHAGHEQHDQHADHEQHEHAGHTRTDHAHAGHGLGKVSWSMAAQATLHCLAGCAIGEVLGMVIGTALGWGNTPTMILAIVLAFFFGYSLTLRSVLKKPASTSGPRSGSRSPRTPCPSPSWS